MKYSVICEETLPELETEVAIYIGDGWEPLGGIAVCLEPSNDGDGGEYQKPYYYQAMIETDRL